MNKPERDSIDRLKTRQPTEIKGEKPLPAGPHSKRHLTNPEATPGTGMLPDDPDDEHMQPSG